MTTAMLNIGTKHWKTACKKAEQDLKDADEYIVKLQCEIEKIEATTIKRCAQELEHRAKQTGGHSQYVLLEAAAAIRALDQAPHSFEDNPLDWRRP